MLTCHTPTANHHSPEHHLCLTRKPTPLLPHQLARYITQRRGDTAAAQQRPYRRHTTSAQRQLPCATKTTNQGENPTHAAEKTDEIPAHARHKPCYVLKLYISCSAATAAADCTIHLGPTARAATATASPPHDLTSCWAIRATHMTGENQRQRHSGWSRRHTAGPLLRKPYTMARHVSAKGL